MKKNAWFASGLLIIALILTLAPVLSKAWSGPNYFITGRARRLVSITMATCKFSQVFSIMVIITHKDRLLSTMENLGRLRLTLLWDLVKMTVVISPLISNIKISGLWIKRCQKSLTHLVRLKFPKIQSSGLGNI